MAESPDKKRTNKEKVKLEAKLIPGLKTAKVSEEFMDSLLPGFGVRVSRVGRLRAPRQIRCVKLDVS